MCMDLIHSPLLKQFSIPCKFSEFEKAGFTISNDEEKKIKPGESDGYAYYEEDGTYRGTIFIFNTSDKDIVPEKGIVGGLTLNPGFTGEKNDLKLAGIWGLRVSRMILDRFWDISSQIM